MPREDVSDVLAAIPLARQRKSGDTLSCSHAKTVPVTMRCMP
jgi:hypothetical protein